MIRILHAICIGLAVASAAAASPRPNIVLIITDDQGYGDLGIHGNPKIRTPNLDALAGQGLEMTRFYVSPVCAPTRASLLTGRYNFRTGAIDTFMGRAMMRAGETTLAEMLRAEGYRTGIFGKWHLGDHYPMRAMDQGFEQSLVHAGGGIGQNSDPPEGNSYFDPILSRNGRAEKTRGYCSDVYTEATIRFIEANRAEPFFAYLAFNAPHTPLEVPEAYEAPYRAMNLAPSEFPSEGHPIGADATAEVTAKIYGMVTNIDDCAGRLLAKLDELKLAENTIVIFMTDNGPQQARFRSGLRERKGSVHDGGIRVPFIVRWPGKIAAGAKSELVAAHIDLAPTLLEACGAAPPNDAKLDGMSLLAYWRGEETRTANRTLFFQWHRGDEPELGRAFAARGPRWKLVQPRGAQPGPLGAAPMMLFDMLADPFEMNDLAAANPEIVSAMRGEYEAWFADVGSAGYAPVRAIIGSAHEDPVLLTRQDRRQLSAGMDAAAGGFWEIEIERAGEYVVTAHFEPAAAERELRVTIGETNFKETAEAGAKTCVIEKAALAAGPARVQAWLTGGPEAASATYLNLDRIE